MNAKHLSLALALTAAAVSVQAIEATQFDDTPSTRTRADVRAELAEALRDGTLMRSGEATFFAEAPAPARARAAARPNPADPLNPSGSI